jgi:hypothetical protein
MYSGIFDGFGYAAEMRGECCRQAMGLIEQQIKEDT